MHTARPHTTTVRVPRKTGGSVTSLRTPPRRSSSQHANMRRSYQAFLRKLQSGEPATSICQTWPVRPYAASV